MGIGRTESKKIVQKRKILRGGKKDRKTIQKDLNELDNHDSGVIITWSWHPTMQSQVALEVSLQTKFVEVMEFQLSYWDPKRWYKSAAPEDAEEIWKTAELIGLQVSFFIIQRMFKLTHSRTHLTH